MRPVGLAITLIILPVSASAHHSFNTVFDPSRVMELEGEVTDVSWQNPHVQMTVRTSAGDVWEIETNSVSILSRMEIPQDAIEAGDALVLAGHPARRAENEMFANHARLTSGQEVVFRPNTQPRWTSEVIGTSGTWAVVEGDTSRPDLGIFRVWSTSLADPEIWPLFPEGPEPAVAHEYPLTEMARSALESFDPATDTPNQHCGSRGMPTIMNSPYPMRIVDQGARVLLRLEAFDTVRTIHMDAEASSEEVEPSLLGHSVGRWEGDTLVVTTTKANWGHFDTVGIPLTAEAEIVEWFMPNATGSRMDYRMRVTDPTIFTEPVTLERAWLYVSDAEVRPYECVG